MSLGDFGEHINGHMVYIVYHGGCPDGCLSALILRCAIVEAYKPSGLTLVPTSHSRRNADAVKEGSTVIFADVSPTEEDEPQLQKCRCVVILDHHASATLTQRKLQQKVPHLTNFSDASGGECAATLVNNFCKSNLVSASVLHLFHRLDVFEHQPPEDVMVHYDAFKGFMAQRGFGKCTVEIVEELVANVDAALTYGKQLYAQLHDHTQRVFAGKRLLVDITGVSVWAVDFDGAGSESIDLELYQSFIDELQSDKAVAFVTLNRAPQSSGLWTIGLRRAGKGLDMGKVAKRLGDCSDLGFKSGGGHLFAAGAQNSDFDVSAEAICEQIAKICTKDILATDGQDSQVSAFSHNGQESIL